MKSVQNKPVNKSASYSRILKSSSLVGGAQMIRMIFGIVSTKFAAILIGPDGVGLIGAYQSITQLWIQLSGLGINQSGVRDVAVAASSEDNQTIAKISYILHRMCWLTGLIGALSLAVLAMPVSKLTFGNTEHSNGLIWLSLIIVVTVVAQGQLSVIQGLRRISDLVRVQIFGSALGAVASITLYSIVGEAGIVPALLSIALFNLGAAWWYSKKIFLIPVHLSWKETFSGAKSMIGLGAAFMIGGLATTAANYAIRAFIARDIGIDGLGMYQAAFVISAYVLNFVLGAMGADFYPRLAGASQNNEEMVRLVNEQTEIGLLLATPALFATLALAPLAIYVLYSSHFYPAIDLLRWLAMGCFLRVISWPMAFVLLAKGEKYWFAFSEIFFNLLYIVFTYLGLTLFGLYGAGIAFFAVYVLYVFGIRLIARHLICFSWSKATQRIIVTQVLCVAAMFIMSVTISGLWSMVLGGLLSMVLSLYCLKLLLMRLDEGHRVWNICKRIKITKLFLMNNRY